MLATTVCLQMNRRAHVACEFNFVVKREGTFQGALTLQCKSGYLRNGARQICCFNRPLTGSDMWP